MGRPRFDKQEVEIRLRPGRAQQRPRSLVYWWMRLESRLLLPRRSQPRLKRGSNVHTQSRLREFPRRCVVKVMYTRNGKPKAGAWTAHARYLTREGVQREDAKGIGFNSESDHIDIVSRVKDWEQAGDPRMWRIIVSPEDASRMDLKLHIRELVGEMEKDLGTSLEWVAVDHHNTDNPHAHLLVRGIDERGKALLIDRDYVRSGIRDRSQEIVGRALGQRLESEVLHSRGQAVEKERWTEIDRALQRRATNDRIVDYGSFAAHSDAALIRAQQEIQRLEFLEELGLARRIDSLSWKLAADHEPELRARQRSMDIIKRQADAARFRTLDGFVDEPRVSPETSLARRRSPTWEVTRARERGRGRE
jgi:type IV secretory pathway VirD2 relaxase